jgi:hypothetical protein
MTNETTTRTRAERARDDMPTEVYAVLLAAAMMVGE